MRTLVQDLRFSLRLLRHTPGFAAVAILVLALGIGVNTAIFSVVHELAWSGRPYPEADRVVQLYSQHKTNPSSYRLFSYPTYRDIVTDNPVFEGILAHQLAMVGVGEGETSRRTFAAIVSSNYFSVLGVTLPRGRAFLPEEEVPGSQAMVAIASYLYWKKTDFDPTLVGSTVRINERAVTIVGVAPEHFTGTMMLFGPELYFPLGASALLENDFEARNERTLERRDAHKLFLVGRLKPGVTPETANAALRTIAANLEAAHPVEQKDQTFLVGPLPRLSTNTNPARENQIHVLGTLLVGMAGIVLLIACLNLANLLLARGHARRKEIAIRLALGGSRRRIVRQLLTEGLVLALAGGVAGLFLAAWSSSLLVNAVTTMMPVALFFRGAGHPAIFVATLAFCGIATVLFALGPALKLSRTAVIDDLKEQAGEDRAVRRRWRWVPRHLLMVAQIALSLTLLSAAALFIRAAFKAGGVETGFDASNTLLAEVDASLGGYDQARGLEFYRAINERLATLPGAQVSAVGSVVPFGMITLGHPVRRAGLALEPDSRPATAAEGKAFHARWSSVGADYFQAMGLPLLRGRAFSPAETDHVGAPRVAIIDETLARKLFPDGNAIGQRVQFANRDPSAPDAGEMEIVGLVPVTRWDLSDADASAIFVPFAQGFQSNAFFHVRVASLAPGGEAVWLDTIRREIRATAPGVPLFSVKTFRQHLDSSAQLWTTRAGAAMFGIFGTLALVLAVIGIYGVKAYAVTRRTREIGIRMALGATAGSVQRMVLREGLSMTIAGLCAGLALSLAVGQACASMLYDVSAFDPLAYTTAALLLALAALAACWLPARRATRVSPMTALRSE